MVAPCGILELVSAAAYCNRLRHNPNKFFRQRVNRPRASFVRPDAIFLPSFFLFWCKKSGRAWTNASGGSKRLWGRPFPGRRSRSAFMSCFRRTVPRCFDWPAATRRVQAIATTCSRTLPLPYGQPCRDSAMKVQSERLSSESRSIARSRSLPNAGRPPQ